MLHPLSSVMVYHLVKTKSSDNHDTEIYHKIRPVSMPERTTTIVDLILFSKVVIDDLAFLQHTFLDGFSINTQVIIQNRAL